MRVKDHRQMMRSLTDPLNIPKLRALLEAHPVLTQEEFKARQSYKPGGLVEPGVVNYGKESNITKEIQTLGSTKAAHLKKEKAALKIPAIDKYIKDNIDKPDFKVTEVKKKFNTTYETVKSRIIALGLEDKAPTHGGNITTSPEMDKFRKWLDNKIAKGETSFASKKALLDSYPEIKKINTASAYDVLGTQENYADVFKFADSKATQFRNYLEERIANKKGSGKIKTTMPELLENFKSKTKIDISTTDASRIIAGVDKKGKKTDSIFKKHFNIVGSKQRWDEAIVRVAEELAIDLDANEAELAKQIYGDDSIKNLKNIRADVSKFSEFLVGARKVGGLSLSDYSLAQKQELLGHIHYPGVFKFGTGLIGDRMIKVRDYLLKPSERTLKSMLDTLQPELGHKRIEIDEVIGRSATYEKAPGYTELGQVLKSKINQDKGRLLDKDFSRIFNQIMDGQTKDFTLDGKKYNSVEDVAKAWNTKSSKFAKDWGIHTAKLRVGKDLDPSKLVKHFNLLTPEAQRDILRVAKNKGIGIQTKALPMGAMADIWEAKSKGIDPKSLPSYKQIVPEFKKQAFATGDKAYIKMMIERIGCPGKASGGRASFKDGSTCYTQGMDKIQTGKITTPGERANFTKLAQTLGPDGWKFVGIDYDAAVKTKGPVASILRSVAKAAPKTTGALGAVGRFLFHPVEMGALPLAVAGEGLYANYANKRDLQKVLDEIPLSGEYGMPQYQKDLIMEGYIQQARDKGGVGLETYAIDQPNISGALEKIGFGDPNFLAQKAGEAIAGKREEERQVYEAERERQRKIFDIDAPMMAKGGRASYLDGGIVSLLKNEKPNVS